MKKAINRTAASLKAFFTINFGWVFPLSPEFVKDALYFAGVFVIISALVFCGAIMN